ncbi:MAG: outer membrane protein assembly factor BamA [candidate division WOR-3 bacterium]|nr:MAG: outer membrane protein assembly factor BamA [candidate division WOR-3 bacterium]
MIVFLLMIVVAGEFRVRTVEVEGNEYFKESAIKKVMLTRPANLLRKGIFSEDIFRGDIEAIQSLYIYEGFLDAEVVHDLRYDSIDNRVDISVKVTEGGQYFTESVHFRGNAVVHGDSLALKMTLRPGKVFDRRKVDTDNYIIKYSYDDLGYADVEVESDYNVDNYTVDVTHRITEGEQQHVGQVELLGLKRTRPSIVVRELRIAEGDLLRYARILDSQRRLYRLGVFTTIRTRIEDTGIAGHKNVQFILTERNRAVMNLRIGYGTRDIVRFGVGATHYNMFGRAWQGKIEGKLSFVEQRINGQVTFPRTFLLPGNLGLGFFVKRLEEIGYVTQSLGGNVSTRFELRKNELSVKYELERIHTYYAADDSTDTDLLHGIIVGWIRDRRDDPFYTKKGSYIGANVEMSGIILPSDVDYVRPTAQWRVFTPIADVVLAAVIKAGMVMAVSPTSEVPVYKRFYCGGTSSVRGYSERSIGPLDENDNPLGGRFLGECSAEVRFPIYKILGGVLFIDGGNIWIEREEITPSLRWGIGLGLRLKSFLGSVRLDYGFKLRREEEETAGVLHFAIGEAF